MSTPTLSTPAGVATVQVAREIAAHFPLLAEEPLLTKLSALMKPAKVPAGTVLSEPGTTIKYVPLVLDGTIKVMRESEEGHRLFLYYLVGGETCAATLSCCGANAGNELLAIAEDETSLLMLPVQELDALMVYPGWRRFMTMTYQTRFYELFQVLDGIAFRKLDERLLSLLETKQKHSKDPEIHITHQDLASELGTSREVVSRLLKQLETQGLVTLGRNRIVLN